MSNSRNSDEHKVVIEERRQAPRFGILLGRTTIPLDRMTKGTIGLVTLGFAVITIFNWAADAIGVQFRRTDKADIAEIRQIVAKNDTVSRQERALLRANQDSMQKVLAEQGEAISIVGLVSCANVASGAPSWLQIKCDKLLMRESKK